MLDPDAVVKLDRKAIALLDPDGPRPRDPRPSRNRLTLRAHGNGYEARGWCDAESAAVLRTALSPLTAPGGVTGPHGRGCACDESAPAEQAAGGPRRNPVHRPDLVGRVLDPRPPVWIVDIAGLASSC